ncbi:MAG: M43 family zinc metalloprotease [Flavobacteriales bacterium]|nr:M43 family zinc metalloprotease [Flavobacteriales bacterium]
MKLNFTALTILIALFTCNFSLKSQNIQRCATMQHYHQQLQQTSSLVSKSNKMEAQVQHWIENHNHQKSGGATIIPVVFHIVHNQNDPNQNIANATVYEVLESLNRDFRRFNPDQTNTRAIFDTIAADSKIQFCLASIDPSGNPTNGIINKVTTESDFSLDFFSPNYDKVKQDATGGSEYWPTDDYLNIWVCNLTGAFGPGLLGFASLPNISVPGLNIDGVVVHFEAFSANSSMNIGGGSTPIRGRTVTHEVGHFFGLRHIWGDDGTPFGGATCDSTDHASDTPMAEDNSQQSGCSFSKNTCSNEKPFWGSIDPPDMVENYMDYSVETCQNAFTRGQMDRMHGFLNDPTRSGLLVSHGCNGKSFSAIFTSEKDFCQSQTVNFISTMSGDSAVDYFWDFGDGSAFSTQQNPTHTYSAPGIYHVRFGAFNAAGEVASHETLLNTYCIAAGIEEENQILSAVYPNPATDFINIEFRESLNSQIDIFTPFGSNVISQSLSDLKNAVDISDLSPGTYILNIRNTKISKTVRFVKH